MARAARYLREGGVVAYPTEGVYGLGCDPLDPAAVERVRRLKARPAAKGFILIAADWAQIEPYLCLSEAPLRNRLQAVWPGPFTFVVPAAEWVPAWLQGEAPGLAVRVTAHPVAAALCRAFGRPLLSTSANRAGQRPARTPLTVRRRFPPDEVMLLAGPVGGLAGPTPIQDALSGQRLR